MYSRNNVDLVLSLRESILMPMTDPIMDVGEVLIDSVFEEGILKNIPIIGTIAGITKAGVSLRERNLAKNAYAFIMGLRKNLLDEKEKEKYRNRMEDPKIAEKELGYVLVLLDKEAQVNKAELYGKAYGLFINENILWDKFVELTEAISRMFMIDFRRLERLTIGLPLRAGVKEEELYGFHRLKGLGLIEGGNVKPEISGLTIVNQYNLTSFGKMLKELMEGCNVNC